MECKCVRQQELPNTSKIFLDLVGQSDGVRDLYPWRPNDFESLRAAARFDFPDDRRAALVAALGPLNPQNPSLERLAQPGTVAIVTGQQVGLFSGPAYTVYKALTAIRIARDLSAAGVPAVPVFWLATEDHDFAEVDHAWVFGADQQPVRLSMPAASANGSRPVGGVPLGDIPLAQLRQALEGLPFAEEAAALVERAYRPGESMGSAFAALIRELFAPYGLLLVDPMLPALRAIAAPLLQQAVTRMPELIAGLTERSELLTSRGYHSQVLVAKNTSLVFLLEDGHRLPLSRSESTFLTRHQKWSANELAARGADLSPNALLRPVVQDYLLPTAAYVGGPAELAYLAQSRVLYEKLLGRQPVAFPRAGFTLIDERSSKRMMRYGLNFGDLLTGEQVLHDRIARQLVPDSLQQRLSQTQTAVASALDQLDADLRAFDVTLSGALATSRRKVEYQLAKMARKTASQMMARDEQARRDAKALAGLVFPEKHLQERFYSIVPFLAKFGSGLIGELLEKIEIGSPDHRIAVI